MEGRRKEGRRRDFKDQTNTGEDLRRFEAPTTEQEMKKLESGSSVSIVIQGRVGARNGRYQQSTSSHFLLHEIKEHSTGQGIFDCKQLIALPTFGETRLQAAGCKCDDGQSKSFVTSSALGFNRILGWARLRRWKSDRPWPRHHQNHGLIRSDLET
jgi:hypothetical protein